MFYFYGRQKLQFSERREYVLTKRSLICRSKYSFSGLLINNSWLFSCWLLLAYNGLYLFKICVAVFHLFLFSFLFFRITQARTYSAVKSWNKPRKIRTYMLSQALKPGCADSTIRNQMNWFMISSRDVVLHYVVCLYTSWTKSTQ